MQQQMYKDKVEYDGSGLESQDATLLSRNNSKKTAPKAVLETKVLEKPSLTERWKTHQFLLVRGTYYVLYSVWMIVMVIAGFIAWLISLLFI